MTRIVLRSLVKFLKRIHAEHLRRVRPVPSPSRCRVAHWQSDTENRFWQRVLRYIVVTWQAVIPPCLCAVSLLILHLTFVHAHPVRDHLQNNPHY